MSSEVNKEKFFGWRMIISANLVDFISAGLAFMLTPFFLDLFKKNSPLVVFLFQ